MSSADAPSAAVRTMTPPVEGAIVLEDLLQPLALRVLQPARDAEALAVRDVDEEAPRERDLGRQAGALRLHRILDRLHEDLLPALDQVGDLLAVPLPLELGDDDLVDVQEAVLLEADLDEGRLHRRAARCRRCRGRCCRRSSAARAARGTPRRRDRPRAARPAARRRRPRSGSSRLAAGSGARRGGCRRRSSAPPRWRSAAARAVAVGLRLLCRLRGRLCSRRRVVPPRPRRRRRLRASCVPVRHGCRGGACAPPRRRLTVASSCSPVSAELLFSRSGRRLQRRGGRVRVRLLVLFPSSKPEPGQESCPLV